ncbi:hypothetical protein [Treponema pedis]|uniref:hypothetical protein n=1 Tax=Treponema pedis TaxID=409322 RepID=UPI00197EE861|nr:hypothetical protein [Treponema pedis]QSI03713.1 hypothetical protein DYQ05_01665 [Treponema pedis]
MKQRRAVSVFGALILAVCIAALGVSCKNKVKPETYDGNYSGTYTFTDEEQPRQWTGNIDKDGKFSIEFTTTTDPAKAVFTVLKDGSFSGIATIDMSNYSFKGKIKDTVVSGDISGENIGKIYGKKK